MARINGGKMNLFQSLEENVLSKKAPLAERMKPTTLSEFIGQRDVIGEGTILRKLIEKDILSSLIFYGVTGSGKTSIARVIAGSTKSNFVELNAVSSGVKELREIVGQAKASLSMHGKRTILFIDEIHRFNKLQQDALLPYVEKGVLILIGATTENPYYEVNKALISRSMLFELKPLTYDDVKMILYRAVTDEKRGLGIFNIEMKEDAYITLYDLCAGDARRALNTLEIAVMTAEQVDETITINEQVIKNCVQNKGIFYDKAGDSHYDITSAFIKSMRGSDPDATVHYLARMIAGGEDPKFIARRIVICASEDVGNADPQALIIANSAMQAVEMIGMPESGIILSQAAVYVAYAKKSNDSYVAINRALADVKKGRGGSVPYHLRDMTSQSMKIEKEGLKGQEYKYPHDFENHYVKQQYMPNDLLGVKYLSSDK